MKIDTLLQGLMFHNKRSPWPWSVLNAGVTFLETSEPVLCHMFVDSSCAFHNINFFWHCPCTQSPRFPFSTGGVKWLWLQFFHHSLSKIFRFSKLFRWSFQDINLQKIHPPTTPSSYFSDVRISFVELLWLDSCNVYIHLTGVSRLVVKV